MLMDTMKMITGADMVQEDGTTKYTGAAIYDIAGSTLSQPTDAAILMRFSVNRAFTIVTGYTSSFAESTVAATAITVYLIKRNGSTIGTITFAAAGTAGTIADNTEVADHAFVSGDILTVEAPATADVAHDELSWTLSATLA